MTLTETLATAIRALRRNKTRSGLTALGIIIGVAAVIAMVAIGEGARQRVLDAYAQMGTDLLYVLPGSSHTGGSRGGYGSMPTLTWDDQAAIKEELRSVRYVAPLESLTAIVQGADQNWTTHVVGTNPDYFRVRRWDAGLGALFAASDVDDEAKVAVLGRTVAAKLVGPGCDAVGLTVRIRNVPFEVIGVLDPKGQSASGQDYDDGVFVPITTFRTKLKGDLHKFIDGAIMIGADPGAGTERAQRDVAALLRDRHGLGPGVENDFLVKDFAEIAEAEAKGARSLSALLLGVALVSLLVGGIGIMNIMLVSVTERTREIGLRMAVGARPRDILLQFLAESLSLAVAGGAAGVVGGIVAAGEISRHFHWPIAIHAGLIAASVAFSAAIGVAFGLYPAQRASRLDPIEALRFE